MFKIWLKRISVILVAVLAVLSVWNYCKAPSSCILCDSIPYHAPCLVNLSTGEVGELAVYESHQFAAGELSEQQSGGYFRFLHCAGLTGYQDTSLWQTSIDVPGDSDTIQQKHFCRACRKKLSDYSNAGFVLTDLYTVGDPQVYPITAGARYEMRCYTVSISHDPERNEYTVTVTGNYLS